MHLPPTPRAPRLSRAGLILALYTGLAAAAVGWGLVRGRPDVFHLPPSTFPGHARPLVGIAAGVALALALVFLSRWSEHRFEWARLLSREFHAILGELSSGEILLLAVTSSVGEELFFRGALLPDLGLWLSSAAFALPHIGPGVRFLPWTFTSFLVGLCLAGITLWTGDLAGAIAAHFLVNFINLRRIVGSFADGKYTELAIDSRTMGVGDDVAVHGEISRGKLDQIRLVLNGFSAACAKDGVPNSIAVGTAAFRDAPNSATATSSSVLALNVIPACHRGPGVQAVRTAAPSRMASTSVSSHG